MLHPQYFQKGSEIELPELSGYVPRGGPTFVVLGIHAGGMGVCVQLRHIETGNQYALKCVRPDHVGDKASLDRFHDELQIWLSASMCNLVAEAIAVVRINEMPCVLSVWMQKGDLAHALPQLNPPQKFEVLVRMVRGLSWVRDNLAIIHRDLKPANVLLDQASLAYVADWGLARPIGHAMASVKTSLSDGAMERPDRTQPGSFLGTITYAAPEQILGAPDIDHRADIYALGCMMFEFETGTPPFKGQTVAEIARQHIQTPPPKIGGWLKQTALGLEKVIVKCLEKTPSARYSNYNELSEVLVDVARKQGFSLSRCTVTKRYERMQLGKGHLKQDALLSDAPIKGTGDYALVKVDDITPFLSEADNLMALGKYREAEQLLRPHYLPEFLNDHDIWLPNHSLALNYALCLLKIGELKESISIFERLNGIKDKQSAFYINFSLALLHDKNWEAAKAVCERGLRRFPDDLDILGNHTISLLNDGDLDGAQKSAMRRLKLRRDIHSIEEAVGVLQRQVTAKRDVNLPDAISIAKMAGNLIKEGLSLNPRFHSLQIKQIQLRRFAYDEAKVVDLCQAMIESNDCPVLYRQLAFAEMTETLADGKSFKSALDLLQRQEQGLSEKLLALKMRILARHYMIGKENTNGQKIVIPEVRDYFLRTNADGSYSNPDVSAEILEWLGEAEKGILALDRHLSTSPNHWEGIKTMALLRLRAGMSTDALKYAQALSTIAPWRAESYDWLNYVAQQIGRLEVAQDTKRRGDEIFKRENALFEDLRTSLDA